MQICDSSNNLTYKSESVLAEMPQGSCRHHLNWLSDLLQRMIEEEEDDEEEGDKDDSSTRLECENFAQ